jgi:hypothetical protein
MVAHPAIQDVGSSSAVWEVPVLHLRCRRTLTIADVDAAAPIIVVATITATASRHRLTRAHHTWLTLTTLNSCSCLRTTDSNASTNSHVVDPADTHVRAHTLERHNLLLPQHHPLSSFSAGRQTLSFLYAGATRRPATNTVEATCPNMELSRCLRFTKAGLTHDPLPWCVTAAVNTASHRPPPTHASAECRYHQHATSEGRDQAPRTNLATGQRHTLLRLPSPSSSRQWHCLAPP